MTGGGQDSPRGSTTMECPQNPGSWSWPRSRRPVVLGPGPRAHLDQVLMIVADCRGDHEDLGARERLVVEIAGKACSKQIWGPSTPAGVVTTGSS